MLVFRVKKGTRLFPLIILGSAGVVIALIWSLVLGELGRRVLYLEYEAFRASTQLVDSIRIDSTYTSSDPGIAAYAIYDGTGMAIARTAKAPQVLTPVHGSALTVYRNGTWLNPGIIIVRNIGMQGLMRGRGSGMRWRNPPQSSGQQLPVFPPEMKKQESPSQAEDGSTPPSTQPAPGPFSIQSGIPNESSRSQDPGNPVALGSFLWLMYTSPDSGRSAIGLLVLVLLASSGIMMLCLIMIRTYRSNEELKEAEVAMREMAQLGEAARTLVHEIKNPLGIMRIQTALLKRGGDSRVSASAGIIEDEVMRLSGLADRLREFLKSGEGEPQLIGLDGFLREYASRWLAPQDTDSGILDTSGTRMRMVASDQKPEQVPASFQSASPALFMSGNHSDRAEPGIETPENPIAIRLQLLPGYTVEIDRRHLVQILDNLIMNARDAGSREVLLVMEPPARTKNEVLLSIHDWGAGVSPEFRDRLFEPFFTTKEKGSGIGLALAKKYVNQAGGDLHYSPHPDGGSTFTLSLPSR